MDITYARPPRPESLIKSCEKQARVVMHSKRAARAALAAAVAALVAAAALAGAVAAGARPLEQGRAEQVRLLRSIEAQLRALRAAAPAAQQAQQAPEPLPLPPADHPAQQVVVNVVPRDKELDRVVLLGERNTATNVAKEILVRNMPPGSIGVLEGATAIKHYMQPWPRGGAAEMARSLVVHVVRNPYDWAAAMHRMCYCCEALSALPFEEFLTARFETTAVDPVTKEARPTAGCPLDNNLYTKGEPRFANLFAARYQKFLHFQNVSQAWAAGGDLVRAEDLASPAAQQAWFDTLAGAWGLNATDEFHAVERDARHWWPQSRPWSPAERAAASFYLTRGLLKESEAARARCRAVNGAGLDPFLEGLMGYEALDCD